MYDMMMRLPLLLWVVFTSILQLSELIHYVVTADLLDLIKTTTRVSLLFFLLLIAVMLILRTRPSHKAKGLEPRISALAGTFLMYGIVLFPRRDLSPAAEVVATLLTMVGSISATVALYQLGRSFSVMAETRRLVTSGPYRFVRHPLYVAEEIAMIGVFMQFASVWTALLFIAQIGFQLRRMHNEEGVLSGTFAEYDTYRQNTARLIPGIY
jgi:protein-S-isoprenylcysteine O-methyltransferase Ste14